MDALARHRLALLGLDAAAVAALPVAERAEAVYRAFLARVPHENLSDLARYRVNPAEPPSWLRTTDRFLRESASQGLGGTCFSMCYALADLLRGVGANAHTALGQSRDTKAPHAAVLVYGDECPRLFEPAHLVPASVPVWPGGSLEDPVFRHDLEPRCGPMLTLRRTGPDGKTESLYSLIPVPAPPAGYRKAWLDSFRRARDPALHVEKRVGNEVRRYGDAHSHFVEIVRADGTRRVDLGRDPPAALHELFGINEAVLRAHFAATTPA